MALPWISLTTVEALETALETAGKKLFFKHSTRCIISSMALKSFEREWDKTNELPLYFIDLIAHRDVSNELSTKTNVQHQSPQVIVMNNNSVLHTSSHEQIDAETIQLLLNQQE